MAHFLTTELVLDKTFDNKTKRHYLNGFNIVFHCHHYSTLYTQLALDAKETELLADVAEESFSKLLETYFIEHDIESLEDKIEIGEQYFAAIGLGKMQVGFVGRNSAEIFLHSSHLDSGWIKKFGKSDKPVNFISAGFITALVSNILELPLKAFKAVENQSIAMGDEVSVFKVFRA